MRVRLWFGFIFSIFGVVLSCWNLSFNAYALPLKDTFNFTQSQVEVVSAIGNIGLIFGISEPLISGKFGYSVSYTLAWIVSPISGSLLFLAVRHKTFFSQYVWLVGGFQFLASFSTNLMYILLISIGIGNFSKAHTGKVIGLYTGAGAFGKVFYASCIEILFDGDLEGFFPTISIIWAVVFGACVLLHRRRDTDDPDLVAEDELEEPLKGHDLLNHDDKNSVTIREMLTSSQFHLIFWSVVVMFGCVFSYMNNVTSIGDSVGMEEPTYLIYTLSACIVVCRVLSGFLFDKLTSAGRFGLLILCHLIFIACMIILLLHFTEVTLYVVTLLVGVVMLAAYSLPLTLLVSQFRRHNYGIIFGLVGIFGPAMVISYQTLIGFIYDAEAFQQNSDNFCKGLSCFSLTFVVYLISGVFSISLHVINFILETIKNK